MGCPLKEAVIKARKDYLDDPEKVGPTIISFICTVCQDQVSATVGRENPGDEIKTFTDSCQDKNPPKISPEPKQNRRQMPSSVEQHHSKKSLCTLIFSSIPWFLRNDGSPEAAQTNAIAKKRLKEQERYLS